jgi:hypothetical protein
MVDCQRSPSDVPSRLSACDEALLDCEPVVLHPKTYGELFAAGIKGQAISAGSVFRALHVESVVFRTIDRFDFGRDLRDATGHVRAVIIPVSDDGETIDLVAWEVQTGRRATWLGAAAVLGGESIGAPRLCVDGLRVFPSPAEWLRAGRAGIVIVDADRARWRLAGERLIVGDTSAGRRLLSALRLPDPQIFVEKGAA